MSGEKREQTVEELRKYLSDSAIVDSLAASTADEIDDFLDEALDSERRYDSGERGSAMVGFLAVSAFFVVVASGFADLVARLVTLR